MKNKHKRNFGHGRQIAYAGKMALIKKLGKGRFSTQATHFARWRQFCKWLKVRRIRDARKIRGLTILRYAHHLRTLIESGLMEISYGQNLLSTVNVVLCHMRGDNKYLCSPSLLVGKRKTVRRVAPPGLDWTCVFNAAELLNARGESRIAIIILLARSLGMRLKEASLVDAKTALREAKRLKHVNVVRGTKGGRGNFVDRLVPAFDTAIETLEIAAALQDGPSMIPREMTWCQWNNCVHRVWDKIRLEIPELGKIHDLRAAFACERYLTLTGFDPPAVAGSRMATKGADSKARERIMKELGHGSQRSGGAYVGSRR